MKKLKLFLLILCCICTLCSCGKSNENSDKVSGDSGEGTSLDELLVEEPTGEPEITQKVEKKLPDVITSDYVLNNINTDNMSKNILQYEMIFDIDYDAEMPDYEGTDIIDYSDTDVPLVHKVITGSYNIDINKKHTHVYGKLKTELGNTTKTTNTDIYEIWTNGLSQYSKEGGTWIKTNNTDSPYYLSFKFVSAVDSEDDEFSEDDEDNMYIITRMVDSSYVANIVYGMVQDLSDDVEVTMYVDKTTMQLKSVEYNFTSAVVEELQVDHFIITYNILDGSDDELIIPDEILNAENITVAPTEESEITEEPDVTEEPAIENNDEPINISEVE